MSSSSGTPQQLQLGSSSLNNTTADDEPDDWDKRIFSTGCAFENATLNDCYFDKKDWRACKKELEAFKECWKRQGNDQRTDQKNV